jgi:hypothetical protein
LYLLDNNIVSADASAKHKVGPDAFARPGCASTAMNSTFLTVTIAEIEAGITRAERNGATANAGRLRRWLVAVEHFYAGRIPTLRHRGTPSRRAILDHARTHDPASRTLPLPPRPPPVALRF